jgi:putative copper export protein
MLHLYAALAQKERAKHELARAIHVLALVHWIGGVAMVTTIVLPHARRLPEAIDAVAAFALLRLRPAYRSWSRAYPESTC